MHTWDIKVLITVGITAEATEMVLNTMLARLGMLQEQLKSFDILGIGIWRE